MSVIDLQRLGMAYYDPDTVEPYRGLDSLICEGRHRKTL